MKFARDILALPLPKTSDPNFAKVLTIKQSVAATVLSVTARVSASSLRKAADDGLGELLAKLENGDRVIGRDEVEKETIEALLDQAYPDPFS